MKYIRQIEGEITIQTMQDVCLICGQYMPEGTGMVCPHCMTSEDTHGFDVGGGKAVRIGE